MQPQIESQCVYYNNFSYLLRAGNVQSSPKKVWSISIFFTFFRIDRYENTFVNLFCSFKYCPTAFLLLLLLLGCLSLKAN